MLVFPDKQTHKIFDLLCSPLPRKLLPQLIKRRGLNICVLPKQKDDAHNLLVNRYGKRDKYLETKAYGKRKVIETSHFDYPRRTVFLTYDSLFRSDENVVLHEVGHAFDFLYYDGKDLFSNQERVKQALEPHRPLNSYCEKMDRESGYSVEQFATAFASYFTEPVFSHDLVCSIDNLSEECIRVFNEYVVNPFR